ncbi:MAG: hypothetical protein Q4B29_03170 [Candidatus Saccharibacteria bacterium]|nr:hypothetical protein [Candidatus Saccharibacteria bacterium]
MLNKNEHKGEKESFKGLDLDLDTKGERPFKIVGGPDLSEILEAFRNTFLFNSEKEAISLDVEYGLSSESGGITTLAHGNAYCQITKLEWEDGSDYRLCFQGWLDDLSLVQFRARYNLIKRTGVITLFQ